MREGREEGVHYETAETDPAARSDASWIPSVALSRQTEEGKEVDAAGVPSRAAA